MTSNRFPLWVVFVAASVLLGTRSYAAEVAEPAPVPDQVEESPQVPAPSETGDPKLDCLNHHEQAQVSRREGRLIESRSRLLLCSLASCPAVIRADCVDWIEPINRSVPSVVVTARARGGDIANVRVFVDDRLVAERLTGAALDLDPGEHKFRFESPPWPTVERTILISEGVKGRVIDIELESTPQEVLSPPPPASPALPPVERRLQPFDYTLGGVALAGLGTFVLASSWALLQRHDLQQSCAPFCPDDQVQSVHTKLVVADVALGTAVVSAAILYFRLSRPTAKITPVAQVTRQGAACGVAGAF